MSDGPPPMIDETLASCTVASAVVGDVVAPVPAALNPEKAVECAAKGLVDRMHELMKKIDLANPVQSVDVLYDLHVAITALSPVLLALFSMRRTPNAVLRRLTWMTNRTQRAAKRATKGVMSVDQATSRKPLLEAERGGVFHRIRNLITMTIANEGVTQHHVARKLEVSPAAVSHYLSAQRGTLKPHAPHVVVRRLCEHAGIPCNALVERYAEKPDDLMQQFERALLNVIGHPTEEA